MNWRRSKMTEEEKIRLELLELKMDRIINNADGYYRGYKDSAADKKIYERINYLEELLERFKRIKVSRDE
jgi:hypothetical protein